MRPTSIIFFALAVALFIALTCTVLAEEGIPVASFTANVTSGVVPLTVQFTDSSTGNITGRDWNFGDESGNVTDQNPIHTYFATGNYTVILTVNNNSTEYSSASTVINVRVAATPTPSPTPTPTPTPTPAPTPTKKPTPKPTPKPSPTAKPTPTPTPTPTPVPTPVPVTPTPTPVPTLVPLPCPEPTETPPTMDNSTIAVIAFVAFTMIAAAVAACVYFLFFRK